MLSYLFGKVFRESSALEEPKSRQKSKLVFKIDNVEIVLTTEHTELGNGIRLRTINENWFFLKQTLNESKSVIEKNYKIVKDHFIGIINNKISSEDLSNICLKVVLSYFQMYNHWRRMYKKDANRDLTFIEEDFNSPSTHHTIIDYFQKTWPNDFLEKCEIMLQMTPEQLQAYLITKYQYDTK